MQLNKHCSKRNNNLDFLSTVYHICVHLLYTLFRYTHFAGLFVFVCCLSSQNDEKNRKFHLLFPSPLLLLYYSILLSFRLNIQNQ